MRKYFQSVKQNFELWFYEDRTHKPEVSRTLILVFVAYSVFALALAGVGTMLSDYHWGFHAINGLSAYLHPAILHNMTTFGDGVFVMSLLLYAGNRKVPLLLAALIAALIAAVVSQALKQYFDAARPPAVLELETYELIGKGYKSKSFPSGHTLTAFLTASVLICFSKRTSTQWLLAILAIGAGLSRVLLGVHWPVDILVGSALGTLIGLGSVFLARRWCENIHPGYIIFTLVLFSIASVVALAERNDYHYAQLTIYFLAFLALKRTVFNHLMPQQNRFANTVLQTPRVSKDSNTLTLRWLFFLSLAVVTLYRVLVLSLDHVALFYDEAYYFHWSLNPALGYYSKPPMVAWVIALTTSVFGNGVVAVKLGAPILYGATSYIIYRTGKLISGERQAIIAAILFLTAPLVSFNSVFITTDAPLLFFWALSLYLFLRAVKENTLVLWLLLGVSVGLGMLSKYTMGVLPLALFLYLLIHKEKRLLLVDFKPWLAALIAGLLLALNLYWNSQHDWIAFKHTSEISSQDNSLSLIPLLEFWIAQIFVFGPVASWCGIRLLLGKASLEINDNYKFAGKVLVYAMLGMLLVISLQALGSRAFPNWAAPWIVAASLLVGLTLDFSRRYKSVLVLLCQVNIILMVAFYHWPQVLGVMNIEVTRKNNPYQRLEGWEEVATKIRAIESKYPKALISSNDRDLLAYLGYHLRPGTEKFARWNTDPNNIRDHYDLKQNFREYKGSDHGFIFLSKKPLAPEVLARFESAKLELVMTEQVFKGLSRTVFVYYVEGFKGYE